MREIFTDKNFKRSKLLILVKIILVTALIIFYLPLFILPFFNHACADDYMYGYRLNQNGFLDYQIFTYKNWDGRFAQTFIASLFVRNNFLYTHYYLHSLLLLLLNFLSIFLLIHALYKYILKTGNSFSEEILHAFILLALEICCLPEPSTYFFWFSSAITYQLPLILLQFEVALLILIFNSHKKPVQNIYSTLLFALVFLSIGLNEFSLAAQLFIFASILYFKWHKQTTSVFIPFFLIALVLSSGLLIFAPGNSVRMSDIDSKGFIVGALALVYHCLQTLWNIFKNPFTLLACIIVFVYGQRTKQQWQNNIYIKKIGRQQWLLPSAIIAFLIGSILLPVIALKGGAIPDRYLNALICFIIPVLLIAAFVAGVTLNQRIILLQPLPKKITIYVFCIAGLLFCNYIVDAYKSLIIAPVYNTILNERESTLKQGAYNNKVAVVKSYDTALSELLQEKYNKSPVTLKQLLMQKPSLLFFKDDLTDNYSKDVLKKYYGLDSIVIR